MTDSADRDPKGRALARVRKFVETYVAKGAYELYPVAAVVENVMDGLAENLVAHGRMYCPCADVEDSKSKGSHMVCPCTPHHEDITRQGVAPESLFVVTFFFSSNGYYFTP